MKRTLAHLSAFLILLATFAPTVAAAPTEAKMLTTCTPATGGVKTCSGVYYDVGRGDLCYGSWQEKSDGTIISGTGTGTCAIGDWP